MPVSTPGQRACLLLAIAALMCDSAAVYSLVVLTCGLALAGYVATRLTAFPQLGDDVGNWFEPLGVVSVVAECVAVIAATNELPARPESSVGGDRATVSTMNSSPMYGASSRCGPITGTCATAAIPAASGDQPPPWTAAGGPQEAVAHRVQLPMSVA